MIVNAGRFESIYCTMSSEFRVQSKSSLFQKQTWLVDSTRTRSCRDQNSVHAHSHAVGFTPPTQWWTADRHRVRVISRMNLEFLNEYRNHHLNHLLSSTPKPTS
jgi:hypothetical protein